MNKWQKVTLIVGVAVILCSVLFPVVTYRHDPIYSRVEAERITRRTFVLNIGTDKYGVSVQDIFYGQTIIEVVASAAFFAAVFFVAGHIKTSRRSSRKNWRTTLRDQADTFRSKTI